MEKNIKDISHRDSFWIRVYELAKENKDIIVISADMGAPALDRFRKDLSGQFINTGIAEQNTVLLAAGLAMGGKKVFITAIAPFIALRTYELIKIDLAGMNLPVTLVGVGAGFSYSDSGPTHHAVEDLSIMRILPHMIVNTASDSVMAAGLVDYSLKLKGPNYVRLDRGTLPFIYKDGDDFSQGYTILKPLRDLNIVANGNMVHRALQVYEDLKKNSIEVGVIDLYTLPIRESFVEILKNSKNLVTIEEQTLPGGMGSAIIESLSDRGMAVPVKRLGLDFKDGYCYKYGGRDLMQAFYGLDKENIAKMILDIKNNKTELNN